MTQEKPGTYLIDPETAAEMGRLEHQGRVLTEAMGGLLPEYSDAEIKQMHTVFDLACGPGDWAIAVAQEYPHLQVVGGDISSIMIAYAREQAQMLGLKNVTFRELNATNLPLDFSDGQFDLINSRLIIGFMFKDMWEPLFKDCMRMLKPGGKVRFTEGEITSSSSLALERYSSFFTKTLAKSGRMFMDRPEGAVALAITPFLRKLVQETGYVDIRKYPYVLDYSHGTPFHGPWTQNAEAAFELVAPFLIKQGLAQKEILESLVEEIKRDHRSPDFYALYYFLTVSGRKPV